MPLFSLHADYDRNGVLNASPSEYSLRKQFPGAIVTPNLDVDTVALSTTVSCGSPPALDFTNTTKPGTDNDLIPISIIATSGTVISNYNVTLKITDADSQKVRLYDSTKHLITGNISNGYTNYSLTFTGNTLSLYVEAITLNGSPKLTTTPPTSLFSNPSTDPGYIVLHLEVVEIATGNIVETDSCIITPSPFILLGDNAPAEKLYMCQINGSTPSLSDNFPSFTDVDQVRRRLRGLEFIPVPLSVSNGDSWLQDQFQVGYCQSANSNMKVIFHLPRLRSDNVLTTLSNGLACIATDHFPSLNLGLFNDFWTRSIQVTDVSAGSQSVPFINTVELQILFDKVFGLNNYLLAVIMEVDPSQFNNFTQHYFDGVGDIIASIQTFKNDVLRILDSSIANTADPVRLQRLQNTKTDVNGRVTALLREINYRTDGALVVQTQNLSLALEPDDVDDISERLEQIHSSHNYGGNIEVSPPLPTAPLGKIILGNTADENGNSPMDPDLIQFLLKQNEQPIVRVDTNWLQVGHVDEIVNFAPVNSGNSFAITLASPEKAYQLLEEIFLLNTQDLSDYDPQKELYGAPYHHADYSMARGPHPVTKLLRGKSWLQSYRPNDQRVMPPKIYTRMNSFYGDIGISTKRYYPIPWPDDHYYDARLSVREINYFGGFANDHVIAKMKDVKKVLADEFNNTMFIELPVIFDRYNPDRYEKTIAFTPDLVNYQTINNHLLIPRPFGPRMSIDDTLTILRTVLGSEYSSYLTPQNIRRKNLNKTFHWAIDTINELSHVSSGPYNRPVTVNLDWLADQFKDGFFPSTSDIEQIKRLINRANPGKFMPNGNLRSGWHKVEIPESKVDVFEAYTQIILESIGVNVHWVDSWYYHIRSGGIHCGTNVIRTPDLSTRNAWWNVQATSNFGPGDFNLPNTETRLA